MAQPCIMSANPKRDIKSNIFFIICSSKLMNIEAKATTLRFLVLKVDLILILINEYRLNEIDFTHLPIKPQ